MGTMDGEDGSTVSEMGAAVSVGGGKRSPEKE